MRVRSTLVLAAVCVLVTLGVPSVAFAGAAPRALMAALAVPQAQLVTTAGAAGDGFGSAIAVSGDTAVVGASGYAGGQGAAYVFVRGVHGWAQQQRLVLSAAAAGDYFGSSVAIDGDTAVIGAYDAGEGTGAAYVFVRSGGVWTQQQELVPSDAAEYDFIGSAVAVHGDTALIGANGSFFSPGAAYVFTRSGTGWTQQAKLTADSPAAADAFGCAVSMDASTAVIGALGEGAAYVYTYAGGDWNEQQRLTTPTAVDDWYGYAVGLSGETAMVGAWGAPVGANADQGVAYVYTRSGAVWTQTQELSAGGGAANDHFASTLCLAGNTAVIGAGESNGAVGMAYVFRQAGGVWLQQQRLAATDGAAGDYFGGTIGLSGGTALVGAPNHAVGGNAGQGTVYLLTLRTRPLLDTPRCPRHVRPGQTFAVTGEILPRFESGEVTVLVKVYHEVGRRWLYYGLRRGTDVAAPTFDTYSVPVTIDRAGTYRFRTIVDGVALWYRAASTPSNAVTVR